MMLLFSARLFIRRGSRHTLSGFFLFCELAHVHTALRWVFPFPRTCSCSYGDARISHGFGAICLGALVWFHLPRFGLQFTATWSNLLTLSSGVTSFGPHEKHVRLQEIQRTLAELERLLALDPSLTEEKAFVNILVVGLQVAVQSNQIDAAAVWTHDKMMSTTEEGQQTDRGQIVKELSSISKFLSGPKHSAAWSAPMPSVALTPHFGGYGAPGGPMPAAAPTPHFGGYSAPGGRGHGAPGQYGPSRGSGGRGRGRGGARKPALCGTCRRAGKSGADIAHSYRVCPLVQCHTCQAYGHVSQNCTN